MITAGMQRSLLYLFTAYSTCRKVKRDPPLPFAPVGIHIAVALACILANELDGHRLQGEWDSVHQAYPGIHRNADEHIFSQLLSIVR